MFYWWKNFLRELDSVIERDPAAKSRWEVLFCYPSVQAMCVHRLCHRLWHWRLFFLARFLSQVARWLTGIEIHPEAQIGKRFFVDHGMGVVIGATTVIGDDVTLYQGVTLGGVSPSENSDQQRSLKRHPTLHDRVIVGSGAQILGDITIGEGGRVGANSVVVRSVKAGGTVVGIPAREVGEKKPCDDAFVAYGTSPDVEDVSQQQHMSMCKEIAALRQTLEHMQQRLDCQ